MIFEAIKGNCPLFLNISLIRNKFGWISSIPSYLTMLFPIDKVYQFLSDHGDRPTFFAFLYCYRSVYII